QQVREAAVMDRGELGGRFDDVDHADQLCETGRLETGEVLQVDGAEAAGADEGDACGCRAHRAAPERAGPVPSRRRSRPRSSATSTGIAVVRDSLPQIPTAIARIPSVWSEGRPRSSCTGPTNTSRSSSAS